MSDNARDITLEMLRTAIKAYKAEVEPDIPGHKRYMAAMIRNALSITERKFAAGGKSSYGAALELVAGDAETLGELASALRSGKITLASHPELLAGLIDALRCELAISNPRALENDAPYEV